MAGGIRVLYVDDEPDLLELGRTFLTRFGGFHVKTSTSAWSALDSLDSSTYDAIISDYLMPDLDGIAFLKAVRERFGDLPFILFTGRGREEVAIDAINNGADYYIRKDDDTEAQFGELASKVRQAVQQRRAERSLRDSERRLSEIIDSLPDATFAIDPNGTVIVWNRALGELTGVPASVMVGQGARAYAVPFYGSKRPVLIDLLDEPEEEISRLYSNAHRTGVVLAGETNLHCPKGQQASVYAMVRPLYSREGEIVGAIESICDITDRAIAGEALRQANRKLTLLSGITRHDVTNQLATLDGYVMLLQSDLPDPSYADHFSRIAAASTRIANLIGFTREYERIGVQGPAWQNVRALVDAAFAELASGPAVLVNDLPSNLEIFADPLIVKVFFNLADNALRHGGATTTVRFSSEERNGDRMIVCEDDGYGIAVKEKELLFDLGYGKNTGFGLALSREILSITDIAIAETGEPGGGARFEMAVPNRGYRLADAGARRESRNPSQRADKRSDDRFPVGS